MNTGLDDVITIADRVIMIEDGKIAYQGAPGEVIKEIWQSKNEKSCTFHSTNTKIIINDR